MAGAEAVVGVGHRHGAEAIRADDHTIRAGASVRVGPHTPPGLTPRQAATYCAAFIRQHRNIEPANRGQGDCKEIWAA
jgi:hypothetical protein